jgi:hypothetical protein
VADALEDPNLVDRVQSSYALVSVRVSYWRGQRKVRRATVTVDGKVVNAASTTKPRWQLLPESWRNRFAALEQQVQAVVGHYCVPARLHEDTNDDGDGDDTPQSRKAACMPSVHLVLAGRLEEFFGRLGSLQSLMNMAADEFCTEDSRNKLLEELRAQDPDPEVYRDKEALVPYPSEMRSRFGIRKAALPTCLPAAAARGDAGDFYSRVAREVQKSQAAQNLEAAVRAPRERLTKAAQGLMGQLVSRHPVLGLEANGFRRLRGDSLAVFRRELDAFTNFAELAADDDLERVRLVAFKALGSVEAEALNSGLKDEGDSLTAKFLNQDDSAALDLGAACAALVNAADSERGMVAAVEKFAQSVPV